MPRLDHVNIYARDPKRMRDFLVAVLGVKEGWRPPFGTRGYWLYFGDQPVIHVSTTERPEYFPEGIYNHAAFGLCSLQGAPGARRELAPVHGCGATARG
jgi:catechol 2,3-dioxygenase-like lactoylglutathione lyase family enzyme